jgi:hypothetical protein
VRATQARSARTHAESVQAAAAQELGEAQKRVASLGQASLCTGPCNTPPLPCRPSAIINNLICALRLARRGAQARASSLPKRELGSRGIHSSLKLTRPLEIAHAERELTAVRVAAEKSEAAAAERMAGAAAAEREGLQREAERTLEAALTEQAQAHAELLGAAVAEATAVRAPQRVVHLVQSVRSLLICR